MNTELLNRSFLRLVNYFTNKILAQDYELISIDRHTATIKIDGIYEFSLWIANEDYNFKSYSGYYNSIYLTFSEENQKILYAHFKNVLHEQKNKPEEVERRRQEYENLKAEFEQTSNNN